MGDALHEPHVRKADAELDTIDGAEEPASQPAPVVPKLVPGAGSVDYPELVTVERRHYQISHEIAKGGMGRVLAARDLRLGRAVAIKELLPRHRDAARRFEREARITARLQHPAIIHVYEAGVWNGGDPFYAMTKVSGRSLDKVVAERKTLAERLALVPNVIAVADALAYAHNERIIHRDLKPSNILVGAFGETVVIDWGLAKDLGGPVDPVESLQLRARPSPEPDETNAGSIVGTPAYMPPEQARGESVDQRADVYALGALLYHVLVGAPPYTGASSAAVLEQVKAKPAVPVREREPGAPPDLVAIVDKAMARHRRDRYSDADELAHDLKRFQTGQLVAARGYSKLELLTRWLRRFRVPLAITTIALVALGVMGVVFVNRIVHEKHKEQQRRNTLLEDRGRTHLLAGHAGRALAYLVGAAHDGSVGGARGFLIADAMRPFEAHIAEFASTGAGRLGMTHSADGKHVVTIVDGSIVSHANGVARTFGSSTRIVLLDPGGADRSGRGTRQPRIIAIGHDHVIRIWTLEGLPVRELRGHTETILDAQLGPGETLVTASADGTARTWDLATGETRRSDCHKPGGSPVTAARFSPAGTNVVSASLDNTMCIWNALDGKVISPMHGHSQRVNTIRWKRLTENPACQQRTKADAAGDRATCALVLTASDDGTARLWDPIAGKSVIAPLTHESGGIASAELSADGERIVTAGADHAVHVWKIPDELPKDAPATKAKHLFKLAGHDSIVETAVFSPDDTRIATGDRDGKAKVWDAETGQLLATFEHAKVVHTVAFTTDGTQLLTASGDGSVRVWDISRGAAKRSRDLDSVVHAIAVAPNGSIAIGTDDSRVTIWRRLSPVGEALPDAAPEVLRDHDSRVYALAFSPDGTQLVSAGDDTFAIVWTAGTRRKLDGHLATVRAVAFSPDAWTIATAGDEGIVRLWDATNGKLVSAIPHGSRLVSLVYSPDGTLVALDDKGRMSTCTIGWCMPLLETTDARAIAFRRDGKQLVVADDTETRIYAVDHGVVDEASSVRLDGSTGNARAVAFTPDHSRVITAGADGVAQIWDASKGTLIGKRVQRDAITSLALTADGRFLWVGTENKTVQAWDIRVETRSADELEEFVERIPWQLDDDDVVRLKPEGDRDGKR
jgi:WD40 repeat protein